MNESVMGISLSERDRAILRKRAKLLAQKVSKSSDACKQLIDVVEFRLGEELYAIDSSYVDEVFSLREIFPVPCTPPFVVGVVNLRGRIVSVVDLKFFFDIERAECSADSRVIVICSDNMELGILTDAITCVRSISLSDLHPALPTMNGVRASYLLGLESEGTAVLDGGKILRDESLVINEEV